MKKILLEKEELKRQLNKLRQGKTLSEISSEIGIDRHTLKRYAKLYDLEVPKSNYRLYRKSIDYTQYDYIDKEFLINNWLHSSKSLVKLAYDLGVSEAILSKKVREYGLNKKYLNYFNVDKFYDLSDPHIWYFAGLIATDGHLSHTHNIVSIRLRGESSKQLLQDITDYYESTRGIRCYGKQQIDFDIMFCYDGIREFFLSNFGIPSGNKTFTVGFPKAFPNEDCARAFILGCFDGDGCISSEVAKKEKCGILTASFELTNGIRNTIKEYVDISPVWEERVNKKTLNTYYSITMKGANFYKFLEWLYKGNSFKLSRKYNNYLFWKNKMMR